MKQPEFHAYDRADVAAARLRSGRLERLEGKAAELCADFIASHRSALALSFGKDSMTVLHILHTHGLLDRCIVVMHNASGMDTPDTLAMRDYVLGRYGMANFVETVPDADTLERTLGMIDTTAAHPTRDFVYECLERPRWRVMDEHEVDGTILGLRQSESRGRRVTIATRGLAYHSRREKADILLPIGRWTTEDVFQYAALRGVPQHPVYARAAALGLDRMKVRHSSPVNLIAKEYGQVAVLKRLYPETFRRYAAIVPAVRAYS